MIARGVLNRAARPAPVARAAGEGVAARAIQGSLQRPLTAKQMAGLVAGARLAYEAAGRGTGQEFTEWRREQQLQACGVESLTEARQHHYKLLQGHWDKLNGRTVSAFRKFVGTENGSQERELALAKLRHTCRAAAEDPRKVFADEAAATAYVAGFLAKKRKNTIETASATDLWHGVLLLRRKLGQESRHQRKEANGGKTRQDSILEGGAPNGHARAAFRHRPATRNPQGTANEFGGTTR